MKTRKADFAGSWYPATARECERSIRDFLSDGTPALEPGIAGAGGIVPHAGWYFSGKIAANVIAALAAGREITLAAVFGMHLSPTHPSFLMAEGAWETPFGNLEVASDITAELVRGFPFTVETPDRHVQDNTIELSLPFIKYFFPKTRLVAVGVPPSERSLAIGRAVVDLARERGYQTVAIGSTDLTHYGPNYGFSPMGTGTPALDWVTKKHDPAFIEKVLAMDPEGMLDEGLAHYNACCS
ncbi:MAG: AmmeMemoRadiSam system protein B, partial [Thermodesulfobacteriota bacterium]